MEQQIQKLGLWSKLTQGYSRKKKITVSGIIIFILLGAIGAIFDTDNNKNTPSVQNQPTSNVPRPTATETPTASPTMSKEAAQKELNEVMDLAKRAGLVISYEFSDRASVVYAGATWYSQTVNFKKDFMAKVAILKKAITGYQHFEVRDAYSDEKVGEVTSFLGDIKVYK